jgi:two-component system nitrogen regulation response regulator NtrX
LHAGCPIDAAAVRSVLPITRDTPPDAGALPDPAALERPLSDTLDEYERTLITRALSTAGGNVAEAARRLKTDRPNLYRRMRRLGIATVDE